ncbi:neuropeptide-like protein 31 [Argiope bruennichi]|uniref:neuropeptide-like protein 31 n=1 Tax=Argiope bruennichi TaxID=94029 RepID=UPI00249566CE|nr:neuropeptide-like protein 31 [Argiope bruennichi]
MMKTVILVLALVAIAACSLDVIPHYSHHGYGHGISSRYFRKAQGHGYGLGYGGYGLGYGGYGGYGYGGLGGYGGYGYNGLGGYGGFGYGYNAYL